MYALVAAINTAKASMPIGVVAAMPNIAATINVAAAPKATTSSLSKNGFQSPSSVAFANAISNSARSMPFETPPRPWLNRERFFASVSLSKESIALAIASRSCFPNFLWIESLCLLNARIASSELRTLLPLAFSANSLARVSAFSPNFSPTSL